MNRADRQWLQVWGGGLFLGLLLAAVLLLAVTR